MFCAIIIYITNKQQDKLRGFVLLCHAEIEDYLESIALLLLDNAYMTAQKLIRENRDKLDRVANALLEKEVISADEFQELIK